MILNGKEAADAAKEDIKRKVETYKVKPTIVVYQVGDNVASNAYVKNKIKACEYCGINCIHKHFDNITQEELISNIEADNNDTHITGMIVQLPLPKGFDEYTIINTINPNKDIDGFTNVNLGKLMSNDKTGLVPATPLGICKLLDYYNINTENKQITIIGRSNTVGRPLANLLSNKDYNGNVIVLHSKTDIYTMKLVCKNSDIIIVCAGKKHLLNEEYIVKTQDNRQVIIDVGIHRDENNKLCGDVNFESVEKYTDITPVPGGVGPMTVVSLLLNTIKAYENQLEN